ncbi:hypothetical protein N7G274_006074 [Stereocaulon virgatum]|uniref:Uncharacterized protein n=1 Tax=Stereocaulon virgatum TaxID=373712 RepID=A0ABR4A7R8_9LECA
MSSPTPDPQPWTTHEANLTLHQCLSTSTRTRPALPNEIILQILDHPSRLILVNSVNISAPAAQEPLQCSSHGPHHGDWRIVATDPMPAHLIPRLRVLVYSFKSRDQGWSSYPEHHGTYDASWTWFEAGLTPSEEQNSRTEESRQQELRGKKEQDRYELQRNRHAGRKPEDYRIELYRDHKLLLRVEEGDQFALWARAMFPGWANSVYYARIDVWCVDDLAKG